MIAERMPGGRLRRVDLAQRLAVTRATYAVLTRGGKTLAKDATATAAIAESILGSLGDRDRAALAELAAP